MHYNRATHRLWLVGIVRNIIFSRSSFGRRSDTPSGAVHIVGRCHCQHVLGAHFPAHLPHGRLEGRRIRSVQLETAHGHSHHSFRSVRIRYRYILQFTRHHRCI